MKRNKGFTLVELLVVIAIIGILSSVVFASLNSARQKARVAAFKSELKGAQPAMIVSCDSGVVATTQVGAAATLHPTFTLGAATVETCVAGTNTFSYPITATDANVLSLCPAATTAITNDGVTFPATCK